MFYWVEIIWNTLINRSNSWFNKYGGRGGGGFKKNNVSSLLWLATLVVRRFDLLYSSSAQIAKKGYLALHLNWNYWYICLFVWLVTFLQRLFPYTLIQYDTERDEPIRDGNGLCVKTPKGERFRLCVCALWITFCSWLGQNKPRGKHISIHSG